MARKTTRVGLIGYGQIGAVVRDMIDKDPDNGMEVAFIHDQDATRLADLGDLALADLSGFNERGAFFMTTSTLSQTSRFSSSASIPTTPPCGT